MTAEEVLVTVTPAVRVQVDGTVAWLESALARGPVPLKPAVVMMRVLGVRGVH